MELKSYAIIETFKSLDSEAQTKVIGILMLEKYGVTDITFPYLEEKYRLFAKWINNFIKLDDFIKLFTNFEKFKGNCVGGYSYYSYPEGRFTWLFTGNTTFHPYAWEKNEFMLDIDERKVTFTKEDFFKNIYKTPITNTIIGLQNTNICSDNLQQNCIKLFEFLKNIS